MLPNQWFLALHRSLGHVASGPGTWTCVGGMGNCAGSPRKELVFVFIFECTCRPKPLTNTVSFTFQTSLWIRPGEQGWRGVQAEHTEPHSVHSCLLTAPGTTAASPGCPEIPADSSVGEQGQHEGTGRVSWSSASADVPNSEGKVAGSGVGMARILAVPA